MYITCFFIVPAKMLNVFLECQNVQDSRFAYSSIVQELAQFHVQALKINTKLLFFKYRAATLFHLHAIFLMSKFQNQEDLGIPVKALGCQHIYIWIHAFTSAQIAMYILHIRYSSSAYILCIHIIYCAEKIRYQFCDTSWSKSEISL